MLHSQLQSLKPTLEYMLLDQFKCLSGIISAVVDLELRFCAGSNPSCDLSDICDCENP